MWGFGLYFGWVWVSDGINLANSDNVIPAASRTRDIIYIVGHLICPYLSLRFPGLNVVALSPDARAKPEQDKFIHFARFVIPFHNSQCVIIAPMVFEFIHRISYFR